MKPGRQTEQCKAVFQGPVLSQSSHGGDEDAVEDKQTASRGLSVHKHLRFLSPLCDRELLWLHETGSQAGTLVFTQAVPFGSKTAVKAGLCEGISYVWVLVLGHCTTFLWWLDGVFLAFEESAITGYLTLMELSLQREALPRCYFHQANEFPKTTSSLVPYMKLHEL